MSAAPDELLAIAHTSNLSAGSTKTSCFFIFRLLNFVGKVFFFARQTWTGPSLPRPPLFSHSVQGARRPLPVLWLTVAENLLLSSSWLSSCNHPCTSVESAKTRHLMT